MADMSTLTPDMSSPHTACLTDEPVPEAQRGGLIGLKVIELVTAPSHGVLDVVHNALLDAQHIILHVGVCEDGQERLLWSGNFLAAQISKAHSLLHSIITGHA